MVAFLYGNMDESDIDDETHWLPLDEAFSGLVPQDSYIVFLKKEPSLIVQSLNF